MIRRENKQTFVFAFAPPFLARSIKPATAERLCLCLAFFGCSIQRPSCGRVSIESRNHSHMIHFPRPTLFRRFGLFDDTIRAGLKLSRPPNMVQSSEENSSSSLDHFAAALSSHFARKELSPASQASRRFSSRFSSASASFAKASSEAF